MPHPVRHTAARRDASLLRLRKLSLWTASGASAAALGLGLAFAHALPGHASGSGQRAYITHSGPPATGNGGPDRTGNARPAGGAAPAASHGRHHRRHLSAPHRAPAPSSAPPVVSSGGS
jgi:hypothetical protein